MATKDVATVPESGGFLAVLADSEDVRQIIQENIGSDGLDWRALPRVKVPAGGGVAWEVTTLEGIDSVKTVEGVVIHWATWRAYWSESFADSGGGNPPECSSRDGITGIGTPGGECATCPFNQFGTSGRGKACKEMRALFVLQEGELFPSILLAPPTSIAGIKQYFLQMAARRLPYHGAVTSLSLDRKQNKDGIGYAVAKPSLARVLSDEEKAALREFRDAMIPVIEGVVVSEVVTGTAVDDSPFE